MPIRTLPTMFLATSIALAVCGSGAAAQSPFLVRDLFFPPTNASGGSSSPTSAFAMDGYTLFVAHDGLHGNELWRTDGTAAGTTMVRDIRLGLQSSDILFLARLGNLAFFTANDGVHGEELWRSDGTPDGTFLVKDLYPGILNGSVGSVFVFGGRLYFKGANGPTTSTNWWTDGGFDHVYPALVGWNISDDSNAILNGHLYFGAAKTGSTSRLWRLSEPDGTPVGVGGDSTLSVSRMYATDSRLFFAGRVSTTGWELWTSDGTAGGTVMLPEIRIGSADGLADQLHAESTVVAGSKLFFLGRPNTSETAVYVSDGTPTGTIRVQSGMPSPPQMVSPGRMRSLSGVASFFANSPTGWHLWRTDGTPSGTFTVASSLGSTDTCLVWNDALYFHVHTQGLCRATVSPASFSIVNPATASVNGVKPLAPLPGGILIAAQGPNGAGGVEPWLSDGTPAGSFKIADLCVQSRMSFGDVFGLGDTLLFGGSPSINQGAELFVTDGTAGSTTQLGDLRPGNAGSFPSRFVRLGDRAFFLAETNPSSSQGQLWMTDGTIGGTMPLGHPGAEPASVGSQALGRLPDGRWLLAAGTAATGRELWVSDGTPEGTTELKTIRPGSGSGINPEAACATMGGVVYFIGNNGSTGDELWRSDGTEPGTYMVVDRPGSAPGAPMAALAGGLLYGFWVSDGTAAGSYDLSDALPPNQWPIASGAAPFVHNGIAYFSARDTGSSSNFEPWRSDGTVAGTFRLADCNPGNAASDPGNFFAHQGVVYFRASDPARGRDLWRTDGTALGTVPLDIVPGAASLSMDSAVSYGDLVAYTNGSDVTLLNLVTGVRTTVVGNYSNQAPLTVLPAGLVYFSSGDPWVWNGQPGGGVRVKDMIPGPIGDTAHVFARTSTHIYFATITLEWGRELWRTDGTSAGTTLVTNIVPASAGFTGNSTGSLFVGGQMLFAIDDGLHGNEPWITDFTPEGTRLVRDIQEYLPVPSADNMVVAGDWLYYTQGSGDALRLYRTQGTTSTTQLLWGSVAAGSYTDQSGALGSSLLFGAHNEQTGAELWKVDALTGAVTQLSEAHENAGLDPRNIKQVGSLAFFGGAPTPNYSGGSGQLWVTDGTAEGTRAVQADGVNPVGVELITDLNGVAIYRCTAQGSGLELWRSDGTAAGTYMLADIAPGEATSTPADLVVSSGKVFFTADDGPHGRELWVTDGTAAGTRMVKDICAGFEGSHPAWLTPTSGGFIHFVAATPSTGQELWISDGSTEGTYMLFEVLPGAQGGSIEKLDIAGDRLFFVATTSAEGTSLWSYNWAADTAARCATFTAQPVGGSRLIGQTVSLAVSVQGLGPLAYQWFKDGQPVVDGPQANGSVITGAAGAHVQIQNAAPGSAGGYTCRVTGPCDPIESDEVYIAVACSRADLATHGSEDPFAGPDGFLTGADFDLFVLAFFNDLATPAGRLVADLTDETGSGPPNGFNTGADFDAFIQDFFAGC